MSQAIPLALSFDDVLLVPQYSNILPSEVQLSSQLSQEIPLRIPIVSAAMDTVSEEDLAIALAREGGIAVIHRNNTIAEQAAMVLKVKRAQNAIISEPFTVSPAMTLEAVQQRIAAEGYSSFPVVDDTGNLVGMLTSRDLRGRSCSSISVAEMMTPLDQLITAPVGTSVEEAHNILYQHRLEKIPFVTPDQKLAGLVTGSDIEKSLRYTNAAKDSAGHLICGAAIGTAVDFEERAAALVAAGVDALFIDAATGHTATVINVIKTIVNRYSIPLIAGNVVTEQGARDLIEAGATGIKVGIGPGSICTTRVVAGVGMPQFTAIQNVAKYCKERGVTVIADGGIRYSGDIVKALAAGADLVMVGSLFAGTKESPGHMINYQGRRFKTYRGMGSLKAMQKGASDRYNQKQQANKFVAEGVEGRVPYKGPLAEVVFELAGGIRSGLGYLGCKDITQLQKSPQFVRITTGGLRESHAHDITITEEPSNYAPLQ